MSEPSLPAPTPFLSLCLIVRDAEKTIGALLKSVDGLFDEIVIVDTGSTDDTQDVVASFFNQADFTFHNEHTVSAAFVRDGVRVVFSRFKWVGRFDLARQFAFEEASGTWRMYLDADDTLEYRGGLKSPTGGTPRPNLRATIAGLAARNPKMNALSMPYLYVEGDTTQNPVRCVRWADGWQWRDWVHEELHPAVRQPDGTTVPGTRNIGGLTDTVVVHHKSGDDFAKAFDRNNAIITKWLAAEPDLDPIRRAKALYHLGCSAFNQGLFDVADQTWADVAKTAEHTNYYGIAQNERVRSAVSIGNLDHALLVASEHARRYPNDRDAFLRMGWVYALQNKWDDAAALFEDAHRRTDRSHVGQANDEWLTKGLVPAYWSTALIHQGKFTEAETVLNTIPEVTRHHPLVRPVAIAASRAIMRQTGLERLLALVDYLVWDTEVPKAIRLLEELVPAAIQYGPTVGPRISQRLRELKSRLPQLASWKAYQDAYGSIPGETYHTDEHNKNGILALARAKILLAHVAALPKDGPPLKMLAIGFQDGNMEDAVLALNERIDLVVCDVAPQANQGLARLQSTWNVNGRTRVTSHAIVKGHYDWCDARDTFDIVTMFEVIEHVPRDDTAFMYLRKALKDPGVLFVSTPIADAWVEPYLTDPKLAPPWYGHVRAHNHVTLPRLFRKMGLVGDLMAGFDGTFVTTLRQNPDHAPDESPDRNGHISILVPNTLTPFDADTLYQRHLGGSEEAVVHLAEALAATGIDVHVFAPTPEREDGGVLRHRNGVTWRSVEEFDPEDPAHERVLFWRCPNLLMADWAKKLPYDSYLWLHDAAYNTPPAAYARATKVLVLSDHHKRCLAKHDGYNGPTTLVANGIAGADFPVPDEMSRDPHKVIYASSPDRGLAELLTMWPAVRRAVPDATLDIYYDWTLFRKLKPEDCAIMEKLLADVTAEAGGVTYHGGVDQPTLHAAFRRAGVWGYCHYDSEIETFCITAVKALASGCMPVTANTGALPEVLLNYGVRVPRNEFQAVLIGALLSTVSPAARAAMRESALSRYDWKVVAAMFLKAMA